MQVSVAAATDSTSSLATSSPIPLLLCSTQNLNQLTIKWASTGLLFHSWDHNESHSPLFHPIYNHRQEVGPG